MAQIVIKNLRKEFGAFTAVQSSSFTIEDGEFFMLLGPSGCGKTTLMRMLAGFEEPSEGRILLQGKDISGVPPYRRPTNMMFQSYALFPHMTVAKNIAFGLEQDNMPKAEIEARVAEMLRLVKLEEFAKRKPNQLSGGQRQRVALARSLAKRPKVLLLDEPAAGVPQCDTGRIEQALADLPADLAVLMIEHDMDLVFSFADRITVLVSGTHFAEGSVAEVMADPRVREVYLGEEDHG